MTKLWRNLSVAVGVIYVAWIFIGMHFYSGSQINYFLFNFSFGLMFLTLFKRPTNYGYIFLVVMLWLGFWVKFTVHLIFDYSYVESIGNFSDAADAWDEVLWVAILTSNGVILARSCFCYLITRYGLSSVVRPSAPIWYPRIRVKLWFVVIVGLIITMFFNSYLGIHQVGLVHRTLLPWPLNALIAWQVSIGGSLLLAVLVWWDVALKKPMSLPIFSLIAEAALSTLSLLSRGIYIFHTIPQLIALFNYRRFFPGFKINTLVVVKFSWVCILFFTIGGVTALRGYLYPDSLLHTTENQKRLTRLEVVEGGIANAQILISRGESHQSHLEDLLNEKARLLAGHFESPVRNEVQAHQASVGHFNQLNSKIQPVSNDDYVFLDYINIFRVETINKFLSLSVDRWIGLEGVMAVVSYPNKNIDLLIDTAMEKRELGTLSKYQNVANSHYQWTDMTVWQFATLPGLAAFLYLSGAKWIVLVGTFVFVFVLQMAEMVVLKVTANPLLCALFGLTMANTIAQIGVAPRQDIPFYLMNLLFVLLVYFIQSKIFNKIVFCIARMSK